MGPAAATPLLVAALGKVIDSWRPEWKKEQQGLLQRLKDEVPRAVAAHHGYVEAWCAEIHSPAFGPVPENAPTVELAFRQVPRRLGLGGTELDELDVLLDPSHMAVLGDLGSGKTTTLRRLARTVSLDAPVSADDPWKFVVVVVCREEKWDKVGLYNVLGRAVGITDRLYRDLDNPRRRIQEVLDSGALILIDGLDEVPRLQRSDLDRDITQLGRHLKNSKVILSCRSADYLPPLPGFDTAEIRPLAPDQVKGIVEGLLGEEAATFQEALIGHPASDFADRPLFLTYLAAIYKRRGTIPDRPKDIYDAIVRLVIQEWDEARGVQRGSRWAQFGIDDKRRFLADLAYELTRTETFRFEEFVLVNLYQQLAERYELPKSQARMVAQELESHTGLLVQTGEFYEFSHLALQEFLAADALVRASASARDRWWTIFPAVAAVTVAMSSDPNQWLQDLVQMMPTNLDDIRPLQVFLDRLGQERPRFIRSDLLGGDLLRLVSKGHIDDPASVQRLGAISAVRDSVADALDKFNSLRIDSSFVHAGNYEPKSAVPSTALRIATPVMIALVGDERLHQIERSMGQ